jgi:hypothetical protein
MVATLSSVRRGLAALVLVGLLAGCAATTTAVAKRNLDVQTKMSDTVFIEPVSADRRTVYLNVRNTSDKPDFTVEPAIRRQLEAAGYRVVEDPDQAQFMLQANVLQAGRNSETAAEAAGAGGFGSAVSGAAVGAGSGYLLGQAGGSDVGLTVAGALLGAAIGTVADAYVQDVTYTVITDLRVSERARGGTVVSQSEQQTLGQGSGGSVTQSSSTITDWKHYQTRIVSTANKVNVEWDEAAPFMVDGLTRSIGGIF